jgi:hypothetical protein
MIRLKSEENTFRIEVPKSLEKAVENLTDKPTKSIADTFSDIWYIVIGGRVENWAAEARYKYATNLEIFKQMIDESVGKIPENKRIIPDIQKLGPALEDAKFCVEKKELRDMFVRLITKSLNSDTVDKVHPSYSEIIKNMSPLDASNLKMMAADAGSIPIVTYRLSRKNIFYKHELNYIANCAFNPICEDMEKQSISFTYLETKGLVDNIFTFKYHDSKYKKFFETDIYKQLTKHVKKRKIFKIKVNKGVSWITQLGVNFVTICLND